MDQPWAFETQAREKGFATVAGTDEAGRGPLAGPVVAAAVILPPDFDPEGIRDSKKLTPAQRRRAYERIYASQAAVGLFIVDAPEIDRINILAASLLAMSLAVQNLSPEPDHVFVDGPHRFPGKVSQTPLVGGDARCISVAAASIVAKVSRDRLMERYHLDWPQYGFDSHKGYGTLQHRRAISRFGACPIHRRSFAGVCDPQQSLGL
ncbi:MAG: ribonuclease HII [Thermodesulfobacteriota bacterium]